MDSTTMVDMTAILLGDPGKETYKHGLLYAMLNTGVARVIDALQDGYMRVLFTEQTGITVGADGSYDLTGLSSDIRDGDKGIIRMRMDGRETVRRITYEKYQEKVNVNFSWSATKPEYYVLGTKVYTLPYDAISPHTIDIAYIREPATIDAETDCDLDKTLHMDVIGMGLEEYQDENKKARRAYEAAVKHLAEVEERYGNFDWDEDDGVYAGQRELNGDGTPLFQ